jgi:hypothetical protein
MSPERQKSEEEDSREFSPAEVSEEEEDRGRGSSSTVHGVQPHKKKRAGKRVQGPDHEEKKVESFRRAHTHRVQRAGEIRNKVLDGLPRLASIPKFWCTDYYHDKRDEQASRALVKLLRHGKSFNETEGREYDVVIPPSGFLEVDEVAYHLGLPAEYIILVARCSWDKQGDQARFDCDKNHLFVRAVGKHTSQ